ncbi:hypothetical protein [Shewanella sp. Shew256]|nr:hypothetical protein [Shewanella sp. Shew256]
MEVELTFWQSINIDFLMELVGLGLFSYALGFAIGYKLYMARLFAHSST